MRAVDALFTDQVNCLMPDRRRLIQHTPDRRLFPGVKMDCSRPAVRIHWEQRWPAACPVCRRTSRELSGAGLRGMADGSRDQAWRS